MKCALSSLLFLIVATAAAVADDADHAHTPVLVRSRPVIDRLPLKVISPVDVTVNSLGQTLVADAGAAMLLQVDRAGNANVLARDLDGVARIGDSTQYGVFALQATEGHSIVWQLTDAGQRMQLASFPFPSTGLAVTIDGSVLTANVRTGEILRVDHKDTYRILGRVDERPVDVCVDPVGTAYVLLQSGRVVSLTASETRPATIGFVPPSASRLIRHADGIVVALATDADARPTLFQLAADAQQPPVRFAGVPRGTVAAAFDRLGNLTLANPRLRAVTRVTSRFEVPCPHCRQPTLLIFSPDAPLPDADVRRSF